MGAGFRRAGVRVRSEWRVREGRGRVRACTAALAALAQLLEQSRSRVFGSKQIRSRVEVLNRGVQISGPYADAHNWYVFGNAYHRMRKEREAIYAYDRAIALNRNFAEAYNNRGSAEQLLNNYDAAISDYRRAAALGDGLGSQNAITLQQGLADGGGGSTPNSTNAAISLNNGILQQRAIDYMQNHPGVTHDDAVQSVNRGGM